MWICLLVQVSILSVKERYPTKISAGYPLATMVRIIFPMAQPSIITIILFNFLSFWNEYIISMTLMASA